VQGLTEDQLESAAEMAIFDAEKLGAEEAEAFASSLRVLRVKLVNGRLGESSIFNEVGVGIRIVEEGAVGYSFTNSLTKKDISDAVERAFHLCKSSRPDDPPASLPKSLGKSQIGDAYDPRIAKMNVESVANLAKEISDGAEAGPDSACTSSESLAQSTELIRAVDTAGAGIVTESTTLLQGMARASRKDAPLLGWTEWGGIRVGVLEGSQIGQTAAENCALLGQLQPVESQFPLLLGRWASHQLLGVIWRLFDGSWSSKPLLGERLGPDFLSVLDNPADPDALAGRGFDDEGLKTGPVHLIDGGMMVGYLTNFRWSRLLGVGPSASATRNANRPFLSTPGIAPTNLTVRGNDMELEDMLEEAKGGVHVLGIRSATLNGNLLSFTVFPSFSIDKHGEDGSPLLPFDLSLDLRQLLSVIRGVEKQGTSYLGSSAPSILFASPKELDDPLS